MTRPYNYILDENNNPVPAPDLMEWAKWYERANRRVSLTRVEIPSGKSVEISTVFLGTDHNFSDYGPPLVFETMIFGGEHDQEMDRYATWDEAETGHARMVQLIQGGQE